MTNQLYRYILYRYICFVSLSFLFSLQVGLAQRSTIFDIQSALDSLRSDWPLEKLHIHLDKSNYILGDTIWYKAYVMDGVYGIPSPISGIVYVELIDGEGRLVQRSRQVLVAGSTHGDFLLDPAATAPGTFTMRAYTRWLQNFGEEYFYQRNVVVMGDYLQELSVDLAPVELRDSTGEQQAGIHMALRHLDGRPLAVQPATVELLYRDKAVASQRTMIDTAGRLSLAFALPRRRQPNDLEMAIHVDGAVKARFPLREGLPNQQYDVQFLPESGQWLANRPSVLGVKVIDQQGGGVDVQGLIIDAEGRELATFACTHKGMGRVILPALPAGTYRAKVIFPDGSEEIYALPTMVADGVVLQYDDQASTDTHLGLHIQLSKNYLQQGLILIGTVRGNLCYGAVLNASDSLHATSLSRSHFPEGIIHFSVLDATGNPLASRMVYNHVRANRLNLTVSPHRAQYAVRDSVALIVRVTDSLGHPVQGNFSLAVTDDGQYRVNPFEENIYHRYFLMAELQGHIEDPGSYFLGTPTAKRAMDNLLLTQGWVKYDQSWLAKSAPSFLPEPYFQLAGTVTNAFGRAVGNTRITMLSTGKTTMVADTLTDSNGRFIFDQIPLFDTTGFVLQARNRRDKSFNIGIDLDLDTQAPAWTIGKSGRRQQNTWFVNLDTNLRRRVLDHREHQRNLLFGSSGGDLKSIMLQEVTVTGKRIVKGSKNLNGPGEADQILTADELLELEEKTLLQILEEKIDGFRLGFYPIKHGRPEYMVHDKKARLIFDGVDLEFFYDASMSSGSSFDHMLFLKNYLERYLVSDILGVEVMYSMRYSNRYNSKHLDISEIMANVGLVTVYIEITTRSGNGPFMRKIPGVTHFRPMPFAWPREFYRPRYPVQKTPESTPDLRATIHWEPMLITDEHGETIVSFYTADRPGNYTFRMEGMDGAGNFGYSIGRLLVAQ